MNDPIEKVISKLDNIQSDITELKVENAKQSANIIINTKDLTDHKEGVVQNRTRIIEIEQIQSNTKMIWKVMLGIGALAGVVLTITRLIGV